VMIAFGLGFVTLVDGLLFARVLAGPLWLRVVLAILSAAAVLVALFPVNILLATRQSRPYFWLNLALSAVLVSANLTMLYYARTRPAGGMTFVEALPVLAAVVVPVVIA